MKIKSTLIKLISFSPTEIEVAKRETIESYNWKLKDVEGNMLDFNTLKGKVIFVNFWATWCPPCVAEMPSIEELYKEYGDKVAFVVVANDKESKVEDFIKKEGYTMPIYFQVTQELKEFSSSSIPTSFIIDKNGAIVVSKKGAADWDSKSTSELIDKLL